MRWPAASRRISRSPCQAARGCGSTSCARPVPPGARVSASSTATAAGLAVVPRWTCTRVPLRIARGSACHRCSSTSSRSETEAMPGCANQWPRCSWSRSMPARLMAQRWPAWALSVLRFWACNERTRSSFGPSGSCCSTSPTCTRPACTVPVATVPTPSRLNTRSMARRKPAWAGSAAVVSAVVSAGSVAAAARTGLSEPWGSAVLSAPCAASSRAASARSSWRNSPTPSPRVAETGMMGAWARGVSASSAVTCWVTSCTRASSTRSILVMATTPRSMPSSDRTARCSRVCGITPSSAATSSRAKSMPVAPEIIVCSSFSWPGTSMRAMGSRGNPKAGTTLV